MICKPCERREHAGCDDAQRGETARYRSCDCQHREICSEPATGPAGE